MKLRTRVLACAAVFATSATLAQLDSPGGFLKRLKLKPAPPQLRVPPPPGPQFGDPLPGLAPADLAAFEAGLEEFQSIETAEGGLGPVFNGTSCAGCHSAGGVGGASEQRVTRFARTSAAGFDGLEQLGGPLLQHSAIADDAIERVPAQANLVVQRVTTPLFGAGLIEAIPDQALLQAAERPQPDGVHGRAALVLDVASGQQRVGRFGWKAQLATLPSFAGDAYLNEMGITNRYFGSENAPNGNLALLRRFDRVRDIEDAVDPATNKGDTDLAADYMRLLAPPPPLRATASTLAGGRVFQQLRCTACHEPVLQTGPHPVPALAFQPVSLYSDLLLHDMGSLGDGMEQGAARGADMRTAPLWGLRARTSFLHDGRASSVHDAIRAHDGEGRAARQRYEALPPGPRQQLLEFLNAI
jgi:CxxC motif-containing protein (DUF1111 family)